MNLFMKRFFLWCFQHTPESIPGLRASALSSILDRVCTAGLLEPEGSAAADWSNSLVSCDGDEFEIYFRLGILLLFLIYLVKK